MMVLPQPSLFDFPYSALRNLFVEIRCFWKRLFARIRTLFKNVGGRLSISYNKPSRTQRYRSLEEEAQYWKKAERLQQIFAPWDAHTDASIGSLERGRQIVYYTPRLPPVYREKRSTCIPKEVSQYQLPVIEFLMWHWSLFPERVSDLISKKATEPHSIRTIPVI